LDLTFAAALFGYRCDGAEGLQSVGALEAFASAADRGEEPRRQNRPSTGKTGKDRLIGMLEEGGGDALVILFEHSTQRGELPSNQLHPQAIAFNERTLFVQRHG